MSATATLERATEAPATTPEVRGGVVPYLTVDGAVKAAEFYARAFGADLARALRFYLESLPG